MATQSTSTQNDGNKILSSQGDGNPFVTKQLGKPFDLEQEGFPREATKNELSKRIEANRALYNDFVEYIKEKGVRK